jgi:hypothetical protein
VGKAMTLVQSSVCAGDCEPERPGEGVLLPLAAATSSQAFRTIGPEAPIALRNLEAVWSARQTIRPSSRVHETCESRSTSEGLRTPLRTLGEEISRGFLNWPRATARSVGLRLRCDRATHGRRARRQISRHVGIAREGAAATHGLKGRDKSKERRRWPTR